MISNAAVLLADDDDNFVTLMRLAFERGGLTNPLHSVRDGAEAIRYLKGEGKFSERNEWPLPTLLLLDLKMPLEDGFGVLSWMRSRSTQKSTAESRRAQRKKSAEPPLRPSRLCGLKNPGRKLRIER